jgi:superfamily I DNA and RNA helicase
MATPTLSFLAGSLALENRPYHMRIAASIRAILKDAEGYFGYKLTTLGRATDEDVPSFLITTRQHGIILLDVVEEKIDNAFESNGAEYWRARDGSVSAARNMVIDLFREEVVSRLRNDLTLYDRRTKKLKVPIRSAIIFCNNDSPEIQSWYEMFANYDSEALIDTNWQDWLRALPTDFNCTDQELGKVYALLDGTFIYENKSPPSDEVRLNTVNDYLQQSFKTTFKQDDSQRLASMQLPPGPQRIRGLAGTGKTIVLSLKAAITHKRLPDYKILYLFNTQSLYLHVQNLISKYYTLEAKKAPDFEEQLHVFHAWGGRQKPGLYSSLCKTYGLVPLTLGDTRGKSDALAFIYRDLLDRLGNDIQPEYDLILIDEAQDFPKEVFEVVFKLAKGNGSEKKIIWAYDEFQSLRDTEIKGPAELFGTAADGAPNLPDSVLNGTYEGDIPKDFVLPNCYRTPRPVLMTAHGVALGLYSERPNEMFYYHSEWEAIGYKVNEPSTLIISARDQVEIERPDENSKNLLESLLLENKKLPLKLVQCETLSDNDAQNAFVAQKIKQLVTDEGVSPEEIIIVNLRSRNNKEAMLEIQRALKNVGVRSVIPGYVESADVFKPKGFVTITTPFRAKGNEANIVFVLNAQAVPSDYTLRMRNAFFVAVTRSRGWCYISGYGNNMEILSNEIEHIKSDFPKFRFICPDPKVVQSRKSFLSKSDSELNKIQELLELVERNPELRTLLNSQLKEE